MSQIIIQNKPKDYDDVFNTNTYKTQQPEPLNWIELNDRQKKKKDEAEEDSADSSIPISRKTHNERIADAREKYDNRIMIDGRFPSATRCHRLEELAAVFLGFGSKHKTSTCHKGR